MKEEVPTEATKLYGYALIGELADHLAKFAKIKASGTRMTGTEIEEFNRKTDELKTKIKQFRSQT